MKHGQVPKRRRTGREESARTSRGACSRPWAAGGPETGAKRPWSNEKKKGSRRRLGRPVGQLSSESNSRRTGAHSAVGTYRLGTYYVLSYWEKSRGPCTACTRPQTQNSVCPCTGSYVRGKRTAAVWSDSSEAGSPLRSAAVPPSSSKFKLGSGTARSRICRIPAALGVHWCRGTVGHCKLEPSWNLPPKLEGPAPGPGRLSLHGHLQPVPHGAI